MCIKCIFKYLIVWLHFLFLWTDFLRTSVGILIHMYYVCQTVYVSAGSHGFPPQGISSNSQHRGRYPIRGRNCMGAILCCRNTVGAIPHVKKAVGVILYGKNSNETMSAVSKTNFIYGEERSNILQEEADWIFIKIIYFRRISEYSSSCQSSSHR